MLQTDFSKINEKDIASGKYVFKDIFDVYQYIEYRGWTIGWYAAPHFEVMHLQDRNNVVASPVPFQPLYRGQSAYYEKCMPSLYRKKWTTLQKIEREFQLEDFKTILDDNPEIKDAKNGGLTVNYDALSQHYGIETNIIDLTNSFGVAAFFVTSDYDALTGFYHPVMEIVRKGVIYFLPMGMFNFGPSSENQIWPIGMEALPRPGEQRGFGAYLKPGQDFHSICFIKYFFWQNGPASIECHKRLGYGAALFPYDPMAEKVNNIRKYRVYGRDSLLKAIEHHPELGFDIETAEKELIKDGCKFLETTPYHYTEAELDYITHRYHKAYPGSFPEG